MTEQNFNDALAASIFVDQATSDISNYFKDQMPGWQGENLQKILSIAIFIFDGRDKKKKS